MNWGILSLIGAMGLLILFFIYYEKRKPSSKELSAVAALAALASAGRVLFAALPNIQPTTFLIMVTGFVFGPVEGFVVGATSALASNLLLGQGPWTPWQMLAWGSCGLISGLLQRVGMKPKRGQLVLLGVAFGYLFGIIMNLWHWLTFIYPLNLQTFFAVWATSLFFDTLHAVGNGCFAWLMGKDLVQVLQRYKSRFTYTRWEAKS